MAARAKSDQQKTSPSFDELLAELGRVRAEVESLKVQLEHQERLATLGTIAGLIAHEFNNILTPVMTYAQMSAAAPGDRELAEKAVKKAAGGAEKASKIATAILGFAKSADRGESMFHVEHGGMSAAGCDVREVVEETMACMGRDPARDGIEVLVEVEPGVRLAMRDVALQHVLLNLVLNARQAMLDRGGKLTIRGRREGTEDVIVEVEDSGRGMSSEELSYLFTPFVSGRREGTGLGMVVCKRLVEEAGGRVNVQSEVGRGTSVRVTVPLLQQ